MTSRRHYNDRLRDIVETIDIIDDFVEGMDFEGFGADQKTIFAVVRGLEIIGEAARHVPTAIQTRYANVDWSDVIGMRNVLIHGYFLVDLSVVWKTVKTNLPSLKAVVIQILADIDP